MLAERAVSTRACSSFAFLVGFLRESRRKKHDAAHFLSAQSFAIGRNLPRNCCRIASIRRNSREIGSGTLWRSDARKLCSIHLYVDTLSWALTDAATYSC
jgi:hypothetical protein